MKKILIVGAGLSGCVLAEQLSKKNEFEIDIFEARDHIGGNCHTSRDSHTGIMEHKYGCHIFNTDKKHIWDYVNSFSQFMPYIHRVKAISNGVVYSFPINLHTINQVFNTNLGPEEAKEYLSKIKESFVQVKTFDQQAKSVIGAKLYEKFFYGYTKKQWGCEPNLLPASILKRIPLRFNYDDNFHLHTMTGIPVDGYTELMKKMISNERINLYLNRSFNKQDEIDYDHIFHTGSLDKYFNYCHGRLSYRTVTFEKFYGSGDWQGCAQINYCDVDVPYTRIVEHKYLTPWETHEKTIVYKEFSKETSAGDIPFYPKRLPADMEKFNRYQYDAGKLKNITFLGRLGTYRYMDMQHVIEDAINTAEIFFLRK
jgi:UDP-galactopyranose mutase